MDPIARTRVPGEDVSVAVPAVLMAVGLLFVTTAVGAADDAVAPPPAVAPERPAPTALAPRPPPEIVTPPVPVAAPTPKACGKLVLLYATGSAEGPGAAAAPLDKLAQYLAGNQSAHALVEGHADATGNEIDNLRLSRDRAQWVATKLAERGLAKGRVTVRGLGAFSPVEGQPETESVNRRVVVTVHGGSGCAPVPEEEVK